MMKFISKKSMTRNSGYIFLFLVLFSLHSYFYSAFAQPMRVAHVAAEFGNFVGGGVGAMINTMVQGQAKKKDDVEPVVILPHHVVTQTGQPFNYNPPMVEVGQETKKLMLWSEGRQIDVVIHQFKTKEGALVQTIEPRDGEFVKYFQIDQNAKTPYQTLPGITVAEKFNFFEELSASLIKTWQEAPDPKDKVDVVQFHHYGAGGYFIHKHIKKGNRPATVKTVHSVTGDIGGPMGPKIQEDLPNITNLHMGYTFNSMVVSVSEGALEMVKDPSTSEWCMAKTAMKHDRMSFVNNGIDLSEMNMGNLSADLEKVGPDELRNQFDLAAKMCDKKDTAKQALKKWLVDKYGPGQGSMANKFDPTRPTALFVGRFTPEKGYDYLKEIQEEAEKKRVNLIIMGLAEGAKAEKFADDLKVKNNVLFFDREFQNANPELKRIVRGTADMGLLVSRSEAAGLVLMEQLAFGAKVLSPDLPGPMSSVIQVKDSITGKVVPDPDSSSFFKLEKGPDGITIDDAKTQQNINAAFQKMTTEYDGLYQDRDAYCEKVERIAKNAEVFDMNHPQGMLPNWKKVYEAAMAKEQAVKDDHWDSLRPKGAHISTVGLEKLAQMMNQPTVVDIPLDADEKITLDITKTNFQDITQIFETGSEVETNKVKEIILQYGQYVKGTNPPQVVTPALMNDKSKWRTADLVKAGGEIKGSIYSYSSLGLIKKNLAELLKLNDGSVYGSADDGGIQEITGRNLALTELSKLITSSCAGVKCQLLDGSIGKMLFQWNDITGYEEDQDARLFCSLLIHLKNCVGSENQKIVNLIQDLRKIEKSQRCLSEKMAEFDRKKEMELIETNRDKRKKIIADLIRVHNTTNADPGLFANAIISFWEEENASLAVMKKFRLEEKKQVIKDLMIDVDTTNMDHVQANVYLAPILKLTGEKRKQAAIEFMQSSLKKRIKKRNEAVSEIDILTNKVKTHLQSLVSTTGTDKAKFADAISAMEGAKAEWHQRIQANFQSTAQAVKTYAERMGPIDSKISLGKIYGID